MIQYLIKNTAEIRVETEDDANALHRQYEQYAHDNDFTLNSWSQTYRTRKSGGEIVEEWYICKPVLVFNDAKAPEIPLVGIDFNMRQVDVFPESDEEKEVF
jgi:hypothetical protein